MLAKHRKLRFSTIEEAVIASNYLEAMGFQPKISNYYHAHNDWLITPALGGIIVLIPDQQVSECLQLLEQRQEEADKLMTEYEPTVGTRFEHFLRLFILSLMIIVPIYTLLALVGGIDLASFIKLLAVLISGTAILIFQLDWGWLFVFAMMFVKSNRPKQQKRTRP